MVEPNNNTDVMEKVVSNDIPNPNPERPKQEEFNQNPLFEEIGKRTKIEQDAFESGQGLTEEDLKEEFQPELTLAEINEYAVMIIDAWSLGMVMISRAVSMNTMTEQALRPSPTSLKPLYKVTAKVMYKYQKKAPLLFLFFITLVMVYFPGFRDAWLARKQWKDRNANKQYFTPNKGEKKIAFEGVKVKEMTKEQKEEFERQALIEQTAREEAAEMKRKARYEETSKVKGRQGRKKRGFNFDDV